MRDGNFKYFWKRLGVSLAQKIVSISEKITFKKKGYSRTQREL